MKEFEQLLVHQFSNKLRQNFQQYCEKHDVSQSHQTFISYLIDKGLLKTSLIRKYTILEEFKELYPSTNFHKTQTIKLLSEKFNLSDRSIWSIIKADASKPNE